VRISSDGAAGGLVWVRRRRGRQQRLGERQHAARHQAAPCSRQR
jgi:hypothetical protein